MLGAVPQDDLSNRREDESFVANMERVYRSFKQYMRRPAWFSRGPPERSRDFRTAYFSIEFGIDVGLPIYSGGLGVLAGDHLKSASDLGLPLVAVGLLYRKGISSSSSSPTAGSRSCIPTTTGTTCRSPWSAARTASPSRSR